MMIAIPLSRGKLSLHFGHCEQFALLDVDEQAKQVRARRDVTPPPHEPGLLPRWLAQQGAHTIIAGGMGQRAQALFTQHNITVVVGAPADTPEHIAEAYLNGTLTTGENACDH